jgi:dTDP-4-amino-4,6-dideoxygalactose transaminase
MNLRMPELLGAVLVVQLGRLDGIVDAIRVRYRALEQGLRESLAGAGATLRRTNDPDGDVGLAMVFFLSTAEKARWVADALFAERIEAGVLWKEDSLFNFHVYPRWSSILAKRTWTPNGGPWCWSEPVEYHPDMCAASLALLSRAVHIDVNPMLGMDEIEETAAGIRKVLAAIPRRFG